MTFPSSLPADPTTAHSAATGFHVGSELFDSDAAIRLRAAGRLEYDRLTGTRSTSASEADDRDVLVNLIVRDATGAAIGCAALIAGPEGLVEVHRFFIATGARSTSAGADLLAAVEDAARTIGAPALVYETAAVIVDTVALFVQRHFHQVHPWRSERSALGMVAFVKEV